MLRNLILTTLITNFKRFLISHSLILFEILLSYLFHSRYTSGSFQVFTLCGGLSFDHETNYFLNTVHENSDGIDHAIQSLLEWSQVVLSVIILEKRTKFMTTNLMLLLLGSKLFFFSSSAGFIVTSDMKNDLTLRSCFRFCSITSNDGRERMMMPMTYHFNLCQED